MLLLLIGKSVPGVSEGKGEATLFWDMLFIAIVLSVMKIIHAAYSSHCFTQLVRPPLSLCSSYVRGQ